MVNSLESSRPILAADSTHRASTRLSTYSSAPTLTPSIAPSHLSTDTTGTTDQRATDIKTWNTGFERLEDKRLTQQRFTISEDRADQMGKIALGAKVDRALGRRLSSQDYIPKASRNVMDEKNAAAGA